MIVYNICGLLILLMVFPFNIYIRIYIYYISMGLSWEYSGLLYNGLLMGLSWSGERNGRSYDLM